MVLLLLLLLLVLLVLILFLRMLLVILPVGAEIIVVVATAPTTTLVASTWEVTSPSAPEIVWPPEAAVVAPELPTVLVSPLIFLLPVMNWRMRS